MCVLYVYTHKYAPDGSKCDLPQVFFCISMHSIITKGERMIKLFFLVKQKTRWKEPGFRKGTWCQNNLIAFLKWDNIFQNRKCGKSHLDLSKALETLNGKILMKQKRMEANRGHERWGRTDWWERAEEKEEKGQAASYCKCSSRINFSTSADIFINYISIWNRRAPEIWRWREEDYHMLKPFWLLTGR